jgi:hypothetical protein
MAEKERRKSTNNKTKHEVLFIQEQFQQDWQDFQLAIDSLDDRLKITQPMLQTFFEQNQESKKWKQKPLKGYRTSNAKLALLVFIRETAKTYRKILQSDYRKHQKELNTISENDATNINTIELEDLQSENVNTSNDTEVDIDSEQAIDETNAKEEEDPEVKDD